MTQLQACHCCGLIHRLPSLHHGEQAVCVRCHQVIRVDGDHSRSAARTAAAALSALILYFPAVMLPILHVDRFGHRHASSILFGTLDLLRGGEWFVGSVILLFSIVLPLVKIVVMLELSLLRVLHRRHQAWSFRVLEWVGRWSMLDVLLLALLVMLVKIGGLVRFQFGPAVIAFALCVIMSMLASLFFDPRGIWETEE